MDSGRRIRWAERENARLAAEYQDALTAWRHNEQLLVRDHEQAQTAGPLGPAEGLKLRRDERVLWTADNVSMVELPDNVGLFAPVHEVYSPTRETGGYLPMVHYPSSVRDNGFAAITDVRVLFVGARANREWTLAQLDGVAHGAQTPMTLMRVRNRQRLSGLLLPADQASQFQFHLGLALADHRHDRAGFVAHLAGLLSHHRRTPPLVPAAVLPAHAPSSAKRLARLYFGRPGAPAWRKLAPATVTLVGVLCLLGAFLSPPQGREGTSAERRAPAAVPAADLPSPSPSPSPSPALVPSPTPVAGSTSAKPKPVNLCGAPANPWNYNFCGGGKITEPPDDFCLYFACIDNFGNGRGYVIQCKDTMFSKSGGIQGSCSSHQGNRRALNK